MVIFAGAIRKVFFYPRLKKFCVKATTCGIKQSKSALSQSYSEEPHTERIARLIVIFPPEVNKGFVLLGHGLNLIKTLLNDNLDNLVYMEGFFVIEW